MEFITPQYPIIPDIFFDTMDSEKYSVYVSLNNTNPINDNHVYITAECYSYDKAVAFAEKDLEDACTKHPEKYHFVCIAKGGRRWGYLYENNNIN